MNHIIMNPTSRTGQTKEIWNEIEEYLKQEGIPYRVHETTHHGHARELAEMISAHASREAKEAEQPDKYFETIYLVGGDGTANEVINGIRDFSHIRFGYVPTGSGNDLGRGLTITRDPVSQMKHILHSGATVDMDLGEMILPDGKTRLFAISAGIGLDAEVCRRALHSRLKEVLNHIGLGSLTYGILTVASLFSMPASDAVFTFKSHSGKKKTVKEKKMIFAASMNHKWEGGGVPMALRANAFDGKLTLVTTGNLSPFQSLCLFPFLLFGKQDRFRKFRLHSAPEITVRLKNSMVVHADGEYCGSYSVVTFRCLPGKLKVIV